MLITPFHNMALCCPATTAADVDLHTQVSQAHTGKILNQDSRCVFIGISHTFGQLFEAAVVELKTAATRQQELSRL